MKHRLTALLLVLFLLLTMAGCSAAEAAQTLASAKATAPAETQSFLTSEEAGKIALDYAGFTADQVQRLRSEFEMDDGVPQYDVEFLHGDWEYEFEIHAEDGKIISFDKDHKND